MYKIHDALCITQLLYAPAVTLRAADCRRKLIIIDAKEYIDWI